MNNIKDFLINDSVRYGQKLRDCESVEYNVFIVEIDSNPYFKDNGEVVYHYELQIQPHFIDSEDLEWTKEIENREGKVPFKMTSYSKKPTIEEFSQHIKKECRAILNALDFNGYVWDIPSPEWDDIKIEHVAKFISNLNLQYPKTEDFIKVYDFYTSRLYEGWKWIHYLVLGGGMMCQFNYPIGEHLLAFLEIGKFCDHYE